MHKQWAQIESDATNQPVAQALQQFTQGEAQKHTTIGPTDTNSIAAEQAIANTFHSAGILSTPVTASSFWTTQLDAPNLGRRSDILVDRCEELV